VKEKEKKNENKTWRTKKIE